MKWIITFSVLALFWSCQNTTDSGLEDDVEVIETKDTVAEAEHTKTVKKIFYNVPSPIEVSSMLKRSGLTYNADFLNSYKKVDKYNTAEEMAINLGIYGADLSYNRLYDQIQESVNYFSAIKQLSDDLGIPQDQGGMAAERLESNLENKDSLLIIISQTYANADQYLKQNDRGSTAALVIMGGWIEALYIATQIAGLPGDNTELLNSIAEQKWSLENLIGLLNNYKNDEVVSKYLLQLIQLQEAYAKIEIQQSENVVNTNQQEGITTIDNETKINFTSENFIEIMNIVGNLRNGII
ncbi:MAG: hypothetical protein JXR60_08480 [Bacteroidales bacterium]|nr:hypothetical protein [Bacteroidales bacterium]